MQEIARFLASHPPFDGLPPELLEQTAATVEVAYFPGGATILRQGGDPTRYLHVIVKGVVELRQTDQGGGSELVETLGEGETFGQLSLLSRSPHLWDVVARQDVLAYLIPAEQVERLRHQPGFEALLARRAGDRLRRAVAAGREPAPLNLFSVRAGELIDRPLVPRTWRLGRGGDRGRGPPDRLGLASRRGHPLPGQHPRRPLCPGRSGRRGSPGPAPCPSALLVLGSGARGEPTLGSDQDHALVLADNPPADAAAWFAGLAEHLAATLERCGLPRCPGEVMATNPARRLPRRAWQQQFSSWIQEPEEEARRRRCWMRPSVSTSASSTATWTPRRRCGR